MTEQKSMVDTLIQNPFGEDVVKNTTLQDVASDFPQEQLDAKRALVDTLPEKQQEQARALAKQIDEKNMQAIISYGAGMRLTRTTLWHKIRTFSAKYLDA